MFEPLAATVRVRVKIMRFWGDEPDIWALKEVWFLAQSVVSIPLRSLQKQRPLTETLFLNDNGC